MIRKLIDERTQAKRDIEAAVDYYLREGSSDVAMGFLDNLQAAIWILRSTRQPGLHGHRDVPQLMQEP